MFLNREEVQLYPVYRDPVHDFGFYRYDPSKLRFIKPPELKLVPQGAQVGRDIRVIGNDAGEQLSILAGTLARLDREAPNYGIGKYNDFNTFYLQAASGTSGGSSGSPVIDIDGRVRRAQRRRQLPAPQSSFYLPLDRVKRALQLIQEGKPVTRGTLQTVFVYTPFDELRRLGLQPRDRERRAPAFPDADRHAGRSRSAAGRAGRRHARAGRHPRARQRPADRRIRPARRACSTTASASTVKLEVERGGERVDARWPSGSARDHAGGIPRVRRRRRAQRCRTSMARHFNVPMRGVYVANPGLHSRRGGVPRGAVITEVGGKHIATLNDFEQVVGRCTTASAPPVRFFTLDDPNTAQRSRDAHGPPLVPGPPCKRDDANGMWPCKSCAARDGDSRDAGDAPASRAATIRAPQRSRRRWCW